MSNICWVLPDDWTYIAAAAIASLLPDGLISSAQCRALLGNRRWLATRLFPSRPALPIGRRSAGLVDRRCPPATEADHQQGIQQQERDRDRHGHLQLVRLS